MISKHICRKRGKQSRRKPNHSSPRSPPRGRTFRPRHPSLKAESPVFSPLKRSFSSNSTGSAGRRSSCQNNSTRRHSGISRPKRSWTVPRARKSKNWNSRHLPMLHDPRLRLPRERRSPVKSMAVSTNSWSNMKRLRLRRRSRRSSWMRFSQSSKPSRRKTPA